MGKIDIPSRDADGTFAGGAPDLEVHALMNRLDDLQAWCLLMAQKDGGGIEAARLVQDTRVLIVERIYPLAMKAKADELARLTPQDKE